MGMFDWVTVDLDRLNLTKFEKKNSSKKNCFQTKDHNCELFELEIKEDGRLVYHNFTRRWDSEAINGLGLKGAFDYVDPREESVTDIPVLTFYHLIGMEHWLEFNAYFENGILTRIERV